MSDYERVSGTLKRVRFPEPSFTSQDKERYIWTCEKGNKEVDFYEGCVLDMYYDQYTVVKGVWFEILETKDQDPYESYCNINEIAPGVYHFDTMFYNGGTCLSEMLKEALEDEL